VPTLLSRTSCDVKLEFNNCPTHLFVQNALAWKVCRLSLIHNILCIILLWKENASNFHHAKCKLYSQNFIKHNLRRNIMTWRNNSYHILHSMWLRINWLICCPCWDIRLCWLLGNSLRNGSPVTLNYVVGLVISYTGDLDSTIKKLFRMCS